jgi:hypothetical protein
MSDVYTLYSAAIYNLTKEEEAWWKNLHWPVDLPENELNVWMGERGYENEDDFPGFEYRFLPEKTEKGEETHFMIYDGGGESQANLEAIARTVQEFLRLYRPKDCFHLSWAETCSPTEIDGFGGGAVFVTAEKSEWESTSLWLDDQLNEHVIKVGNPNERPSESRAS